MRTSLCATLLAVVIAVMAPMAGAHTTVTTADGKYFVTVGNLNEPVTTYVKTGLDLQIRANESGQRGAEIGGAHLTLAATLMAPGGAELSDGLRVQFGTTGRYSFVEPYVLTEPGEYHLRLRGTIEGSPADFDGVLVGSGPVPDIGDHYFPAGSDSPQALQARVAALEGNLAALEAKNQALQADLNFLKAQIDHGDADGGAAPGPSFAVALIALATLTVLIRRRAPA